MVVTKCNGTMVSDDGRLRGLLHKLQQHSNLSSKQKLSLICKDFAISESQLDRTIACNPEVLRTVKGHVAEVALDYVFASTGADIQPVGGDSNVDRIINERDVQIKTLYMAGTNLGKGITSYKCHKTHGAKSEREGAEYYELASEYPDIVVGLVSLSPFRILVLLNEEIPRHQIFSDRLLSPFKVNFPGHPGLNNFSRLGIESAPNATKILVSENPEFLPLTATAVGESLGLGAPLRPDIILETILTEENFRIWDMSVRGFMRETVFQDRLTNNGSKVHPAGLFKRARSNKTDGLLINIKGVRAYFQMKGLSVNNCNFETGDVGIEVQLSRGRINDHETQSRMYLKSSPAFNPELGPDFDFLIIAIEPPLSRLLFGHGDWSFHAIPTKDLVSHPSFSHRIKPIQKFSKADLKRYQIPPTWWRAWQG